MLNYQPDPYPPTPWSSAFMEHSLAIRTIGCPACGCTGWVGEELCAQCGGSGSRFTAEHGCCESSWLPLTDGNWTECPVCAERRVI